jgi:hypothetical protein
LSIQNGDGPITIAYGEGQVYLVQRHSPQHSCFYNDSVFEAESYLLPINSKYLWLVYRIASESGHFAMDLLDSWRAELSKCSNGDEIEKLSAEEAIGQLDSLITKASQRADQVALYADWATDMICRKRWQRLKDPRCFMLDLFSPFLGLSLIGRLCERMGIDHPRIVEPLVTTVATPELSSKRAPTKRAKITSEDYKGHKSLTAFFTKKVQ